MREILPELVVQLVKLCSSDEFEQQEVFLYSFLGLHEDLRDMQTATRTTAELCRKFGEKILGEVIPILQRVIASPNARIRQGVCLTLSDIMYLALVTRFGLLLTDSQGEYDGYATRRPRERNYQYRPVLPCG